MPKFGSPLEINYNELRNALLQSLSTAPVTAFEGQVFQNTTTHEPEFYNGTDWTQFRNAILFNGQNAAWYRDRDNHTGTQLAATISDFNTAVRTNRLDQLAAPTNAVSLNNQILSNLANAVSDGDAVPLSQIRAMVNGMDNKASVKVAATANVTVSSAPAAIDGVTLAQDDLVLLPYQSTGSQNGLYVFNGTGNALTRATNADTSAEVTAGLYVFVSEGTVNGNRGFQLFTDDPIVLGTTSLNFQIVSGAGQVTATAPIVKTGDTLSLATSADFDVSGGNLILTDKVAAGTYNSVTVDAKGRVTAGTNPSSTSKFSQDIGDGSATSFVVTHNLNTRDIIARVRQNASPYNFWEVDIEATSVNTATIRFTTAPISAEFRVIILG